MNTITQVPPGFRFHPTDEELVDYYLRRKVASRRIDLDVIKEVDLYRIEPWDLQELCGIGSTEEQDEWYFFSHKDKKYPTGTRTNRATSAGFWKATGRDKAIYSKNELVGMRKTLVFYKGRAPNGQKSDWIMHEYRLETDENGTPQEEGWVVCRVFKKRIANARKPCDHDSPIWYDDHMESPNLRGMHHHYYSNNTSCKKEMDHNHLQYYSNGGGITITPPADHLLQLPHLESPKMPSFGGMSNSNPGIGGLQSLVNNHGFDGHYKNFNSVSMKNDHDIEEYGDDQLTDWRVFDKFVASQLSHDHQETSNENIIDDCNNFHAVEESDLMISGDFSHHHQQEMVQEHDNGGLVSSSRCPIDLWK